MAKVQKPLLSGSASGQIGKTLVFMQWKGIKDVRSHVIPTNPRTVKQVQQRTYFTQSVDKFHAANFASPDLEALNRAAGIEASAMSGFNWFVKGHVANLRANIQTNVCKFVSIVKDTVNSKYIFTFHSETSSGMNVYLGMSPRQLTIENSCTGSSLPQADGIYTGQQVFEVPFSQVQDGTSLYFQLNDPAHVAPLCGIFKWVVGQTSL